MSTVSRNCNMTLEFRQLKIDPVLESSERPNIFHIQRLRQGRGKLSFIDKWVDALDIYSHLYSSKS